MFEMRSMYPHFSVLRHVSTYGHPVSTFTKFSWDGRAEIIFLFYQMFLHMENGKIMEIQSEIVEFCSNENF